MIRHIRNQAQFNQLNTYLGTSAFTVVKLHALPDGGEYQCAGELIVTTNNIIIEGVNMPKIKGNSSASCIFHVTNYVTWTSQDSYLENVVIRGVQLIPSSTTQEGIRVGSIGKKNINATRTAGYGKGLTVDNCYLLGFSGNAITTYNSVGGSTSYASNMTISNCKITGMGLGNGIYLNQCFGISIRSNYIERFSVGIALTNTELSTVSDNYINKCSNGISSSASTSTHLVNNHIINGSTGIDSGNYTSIVNNTVSNMSTRGIRVGGAYASAISNTVTNSKTGIDSNGSARVKVSSNIMQGCDTLSLLSPDANAQSTNNLVTKSNTNIAIGGNGTVCIGNLTVDNVGNPNLSGSTNLDNFDFKF